MPAKVTASAVRTTDEDGEEPTWDTTPLSFGLWYTALPEYLDDQDPDYVTMYESGYCMDKHIVNTPTVFHAVAIRDRQVRTHTFEEPISPDIFDEHALPRHVRELSTTDKERVRSAPEYFRKKDRAMARAVLRTITVTKVRKVWKKKCESSGIRLLNLLADYSRDVGPSANNAIAGKLHRAVTRGPEGRTVAFWNMWQDYFDNWNAAQSESAKLDPSIVASKYEAAARTRRAPRRPLHPRDSCDAGAR